MFCFISITFQVYDKLGNSDDEQSDFDIGRGLFHVAEWAGFQVVCFTSAAPEASDQFKKSDDES